ncbi:hypothetical protein [Erythrobacter ani]|uniref:Uncharacterized protein n=1 Tax=Erythrobacter ani TaxID=2827235 RepID=A0ABS6SKP0_9SPHN|nr:hypothetical protein [Erythrobacter ani]MBV7265559.1 hypothetical protein [Erythrobacter ani]
MSNMPTSTNGPTTIADLTSDPFAPAAFETLFLRPRYLVDSPSVAHVPFLFWACATLRLRNVAVVGAGDGVLHFALCQTLEQMSDTGICVGHGFWEDAENEERPSGVPPELARHEDMLYEDISRLAPGADLDKLVDSMPESSLDLIILDLAAAPEGLAQRLEVLASRLSKSGILFVHGENTVQENGADAAALERFMKAHRSVHFSSEQGFRMFILTGDKPHHLGALFEASESGHTTFAVEKVFRRVGQGLLGVVRAAKEKSARIEAEGLATENRAAFETTQSKYETLVEAYDLRTRRIAEIESQLFDDRAIIAELRAQAAVREVEHESLKAAHKVELADLEKELAEHVSALTKETARYVSLEKDFKAEREMRFSETTALTRMTESLRKEIAALKTKHNSALESQHDQFARRSNITAQLTASKNRLQADLLQFHRLRARKKAKDRIAKEIDLVKASEWFDPEWYVATYPDIANSGAEPARHFVLHGGYELRNPGPDFDSLEYHKVHADVTEAGIPAFIHYLDNGRIESRQTFRVDDSA